MPGARRDPWVGNGDVGGDDIDDGDDDDDNEDFD